MRQAQAATLRDALDDFDVRLRSGHTEELRPHPVGYPLLDQVLGGGLRRGELTLVGGPPGVGKTVALLHWARNLALRGVTAVFACYEHDSTDLLGRLLSLELGEASERRSHSSVEELRRRLQSTSGASEGVPGLFAAIPFGDEVVTTLNSYGDNLRLLPATGAHTTVAELDAAVPEDGNAVLFVDYVQKVALHPEPATEEEKVTRNIEALKDLALRRRIPVVAIAAADRDALRSRRVRLHHLRGSAALAYECDVALVLNEKFASVSKVHLAYDPVRAATFREWVVLTLEKNRGGPSHVDLEFRKDFAHFRFDPRGGFVSDRLIDERLDLE